MRARPEKRVADRAYAAARRRADPEGVWMRDRALQRRLLASPRTWVKRNLYAVKRRAEERGIPFDLAPADVPPSEICPILGVPIAYGAGPGHPYLPSVDRVDPSKGYVRGNVWVVSRRANTIKNDARFADVWALIVAIRRRQENA